MCGFGALAAAIVAGALSWRLGYRFSPTGVNKFIEVGDVLAKLVVELSGGQFCGVKTHRKE
jgi:hypothetical protein